MFQLKKDDIQSYYGIDVRNGSEVAPNVYCNFLQYGSEFLPVVLSHLIIKKN